MARGGGKGVRKTDVPVFFLAGSIKHVEERNLVVDHALLAIRIFDGLPNPTPPPGNSVQGRFIQMRSGPAYWVISEG